MAMSNSNLACDTVIRLETFAELFSLQGDKDSSQEISLRGTRSEQTAIIVQALYDMTSHKLQQKLFYLFCTPEGILFDM